MKPIDVLYNERFAIAGAVEFAGVGSNGLVSVKLSNRLATATLSLLGGHCTDFTPRGSMPVLWMSPTARIEHGRAIRGGAPVLWPWFGDHPDEKGFPAHGFVRTLLWEPVDTRICPNGDTELRLAASDSVVTRSLWPHNFDLELVVRVGVALDLTLTACNTGTSAVRCGGGFHPYFRVGDIKRISVTGLNDHDYLDKVRGMRRYSLDGDLRFREEIDRVFVDVAEDVSIVDPALRRRIRVSGRGSQTRVVWNPWTEKAARLSDFPNDAWQEMLCVEVVNAQDDTRLIAPGASHTISQRIEVERL